MKRVEQKQSPEGSLGKSLKLSLVIHLVLLFLALVQDFFFQGQPKTYIPSLRVDLVALPDLLKSETKKIHQRELQKELSQILAQAEKKAQKIQKEQSLLKRTPSLPAAKPHEMTLTPSTATHPKEISHRNRQALDRLKLLAKIHDKIRESPQKTSPSPLLIKGNQISQGSSLSSDARESLEQNYSDLLKDRLQENWSLPPWISRQNLSAQVEIRIDAQGHLSRVQFVKPSGNSQFDEAVKKTLQLSQPFPHPPEEVRLSLQKNGILIGFPL
jgi:TonB family protein